MTLGAQRTSVLHLVMRESLLLVLIERRHWSSWRACNHARSGEHAVHGLAPHDPTTILIAVAMLILFATLAAYATGTAGIESRSDNRSSIRVMT
jgi:hypothetical protein